MNLWRLRQFVAVAEELHITRAAARLYIDQGSLSTSIRKLERELAVVLFARTSRRVELTPAGERLVPYARDLCVRADAMQPAVRHERSRSATHELRVGLLLGQSAAAELTGPIMHAFVTRHPEITVRARTLDVDDPWGVAVDDLDLVISRDAGAAGDVVTPLFNEPCVLVLSADDELVTERRPVKADLLGRTWCSIGEAPPTARSFREAYAAPADHDGPLFEIPHEGAVESFRRISEHHALGLTPAGVARLVAVPGVVYRPVEGMPMSTVAVMERRPDSRTRAFRDTAVTVTRALQGLVPDAVTPL